MPSANPVRVDVGLGPEDLAAALRADVAAGLASVPKELPSKWFYDEEGSGLFDAITRLPEYYPTRAERAILGTRATEVAELTGAATLIELGSGTSEKTRLLLDALAGRGVLRRFVPFDVSETFLRSAAERLARQYPRVSVHAVVGDFERHLGALPRGGRRLVAFLGGTIGNLPPSERREFLSALRASLNPGELLLLGTGLITDPAVMVPAYDDAAGVTAEFNRNVLRVLNRELGADFDVTAFDHVAVWNPAHEWIEMRLQARRAMTVRLPAVNMTVRYAPGEQMRTEISKKFSRDGLSSELDAAGFDLMHWWTDPAERFVLSLATRR